MSDQRMRMAAMMLLLTALGGCEATAVATLQQQYRSCLDIEIRAIALVPGLTPEEAADVILEDCSPHEDALMRNATLRGTVKFRAETRAWVIADIREARR